MKEEMQRFFKEKYSFEDLVEIIAALRSENGCPWDKVQTHDSLRPCVMEEAAELVGAIRIYNNTNNAENMCEELGDLMLQVLLHSEIAKEESLFTIEDVIQGISDKMIRRHPHVFGTAEAGTSEQALANWDEIKKKEKETQTWIESPLREIPQELPALTRAPKILKKIDKLYEPVDSMETSVHKLEEAVAQLKQQAPSHTTEALIADILLQTSNISRLCKLPQEQLLNDKLQDLIEKYEDA